MFRGNHLLAMVGTWISNPLTYLPLYWFNYQVGASLLGSQGDLKYLHNLSHQELWEQGWLFSRRLLLGSSLVGLIAAIITGSIVYLFLKRNSHKNFIL